METNKTNIKVIPHSIEAERAVIGGLLLDNNKLEDVVCILNGDDFYQGSNSLIFKNICLLAKNNTPFDVVTLSDIFKRKRILRKIGGAEYLTKLSNTTVVTNICAYAKIVKEKSILRQLLQASQEILGLVLDQQDKSVQEILDIAESRIFNIAEAQNKTNAPTDIVSLLTKTLEKIDDLYESKSAIPGIPTGFGALDEITCGLNNGDLIILAGRPAMGKTSLAINIAEHIAIKEKKAALIFSMEMPADSIVMRMISSIGKVDQTRIKTGKIVDIEWERISKAVKALSGTQIYIDDRPSLHPNEIRTAARLTQRKCKNLGVIIVDYLQLMKIDDYKNNRTGEISAISMSLKSLARELNIPIIALSQLNRGLELRSDRRPIMSDLRDSGAIEQDADVILFVYRDEVYNNSSQDKGMAEIIISKQRNGLIGKIKLIFKGQYTKFETTSSEINYL